MQGNGAAIAAALITGAAAIVAAVIGARLAYPELTTTDSDAVEESFAGEVEAANESPPSAVGTGAEEPIADSERESSNDNDTDSLAVTGGDRSRRSISGVVTTQLGEPLAGIIVSLSAGETCSAEAVIAKAVTSDDGAFTFEDIEAGRYRLLYNGWSGSAKRDIRYGGHCSSAFDKRSEDAVKMSTTLNYADLRILSPADSASASPGLTIEWDPYPGAASYSIVLSRLTPEYEPIEFGEETGATTTQTTFQLSYELELDAKYWVIVYAHTSGGVQFAFGEAQFVTLD